MPFGAVLLISFPPVLKNHCGSTFLVMISMESAGLSHLVSAPPVKPTALFSSQLMKYPWMRRRSVGSARLTEHYLARFQVKTHSMKRFLRAILKRGWNIGCRCSMTSWKPCSTTCRKHLSPLIIRPMKPAMPVGN